MSNHVQNYVLKILYADVHHKFSISRLSNEKRAKFVHS